MGARGLQAVKVVELNEQRQEYVGILRAGLGRQCQRELYRPHNKKCVQDPGEDKNPVKVFKERQNQTLI